MLINPINTTINHTNFKAYITPTPSLKEGFSMAESNAHSGIMKNMNYAKEFLDSIARISESKRVSEFKIDIDKRRENHTYTRINGRRVNGGHNEFQPNIQDSYLVVEGTKRYASKLEELKPSYLDILKSQIEEAEAKLEELKDRYSNQLIAEVQQAQKMIFKNAE